VTSPEGEVYAPFIYMRGKKSGRPSEHALPYWRLPERLYDDPDELALWARRAFAAAEPKKFAPRGRVKRKKIAPRRPAKEKVERVSPRRNPSS
jgi:DNA transformation protein and related proteins